MINVPYHKMDKQMQDEFNSVKNDVSSLNKVIDIIHRRVVGILCPGHSLRELVDRIEEFSGFPICWIGVNREDEYNDFLGKIGAAVEVVTAFPAQYLTRTYKCHKHMYDKDRGCSIYKILVQLGSRNQKQRIFLFGADGYAFDNESPYYLPDVINATREHHKRDVEFVNQNMPKMNNVFNVSERSRIDVFKKISYDECLEWLNGNLK